MVIPEMLGTLASIGGLVVLVLVGAILLGVRRPAKRRPDDRTGPGAASGAFGELVEVFQPTRAHVTAELERKRHDLVEVPGSAPGWTVDLESGFALLRPATVDEPELPRRE